MCSFSLIEVVLIIWKRFAPAYNKGWEALSMIIGELGSAALEITKKVLQRGV